MSRSGDTLAIPPKQYWDLSRTWQAWNKLSVADVFQLREEAAYRGQDVYFWLNHPIRYVRLVGIIVQIELVASGRYALITLDDSSGANIELKVERRVTTAHAAVADAEELEYPSNTHVDNLDVNLKYGMPSIYIDKRHAGIGGVIRAQGTITTFMKERQILLKRVFWVKDTNEEAMWWGIAAKWKEEQLQKPWVLTEAEKSECDEKMRNLERHEARKREHQRKRADKKRRHEVREEQREDKERGEQARVLDEGALEGSEVLWTPWT